MRNEFGEIFLWLKATGLRILVIATASLLLVRLLRLISERLVRLVEGEAPPPASERGKRAVTMAGLLRTVGSAIVLVIAGMMVLREMGIDITPIIAGAGVAGLALGFGAQSLIKDVIVGAFILLEDQFHVGDVIETAGVAGQVERMTLRVTAVRDLRGALHFIPNGEIKVVSNLTKEWSRAVLDVGVAYHEDIDRVLEVLRQVGVALQRDDHFGKLIAEPPEILGVDALADSQVTVRVVVKTLPLKQWEVAREFRRRIKKTFDAEGIEIPFPHRIVISRPDRPSGSPSDRSP